MKHHFPNGIAAETGCDETIDESPCGFDIWAHWCKKLRTVTSEECKCEGQVVAYRTTCTSTGATNCHAIFCDTYPTK